MVLGEGAGRDPGREGRSAFLGDVLRGDQHLAVLLEFGQRRIPDKAAVEIAAIVAGDDFGLRDREHLHVLLVQAEALDQREQLVVVGRDGRGRELLALEIGERIDARAVTHDKRFVDSRDRGEIERLHVEAARGRRGEWARPDIADLHVAGGDRRKNLRARIEAAEVDLDPGRLVEFAVRRFQPTTAARRSDNRRQRSCPQHWRQTPRTAQRRRLRRREEVSRLSREEILSWPKSSGWERRRSPRWRVWRSERRPK